ncbi:1,4-dihydroxy-2-naphthoate polyprenyltransferase [Bacillus marinisedimentorum]|uniref:1,4-dihydroxy-2-naphthoate polyprenyltransferase n=1 Tax=Bacillus marinisedimentorum TaxID=1821260 RepID=UPI0008732210|nr:1,4-dihydroxy-2-naphthoate polyprenyltransferase [Bacillus marinisedimentorum]
MQPTVENTHEKAIAPKKGWRVWWNLLRPHTLTASFVPVFLGTAIAVQYGPIDFALFFAMFLASVLIQSATNMFNEYYDFKRGLDNHESVGIGGAIVREGVSASTVLSLALAFFAGAIALGVYICMETTWWLAVIGLVSMSVGYFYTGGPYPIAYTPFGELASGIFMGYGIILISFYVQTGTVTGESILISTPIAILVGAILMANNIRDHDGDKENGRKTLAILLGQQQAVRFLAGMFIVSYAWIAILAAAGVLTPWALLIFISTAKAREAVKGFKNKKKPAEMMPGMKATAQTNTFFGFLLTLGILFSYMA